MAGITQAQHHDHGEHVLSLVCPEGLRSGDVLHIDVLSGASPTPPTRSSPFSDARSLAGFGCSCDRECVWRRAYPGHNWRKCGSGLGVRIKMWHQHQLRSQVATPAAEDLPFCWEFFWRRVTAGCVRLRLAALLRRGRPRRRGSARDGGGRAARRAPFASRSVRRALLTSQVNPGSLYCCRRTT